MILFLDTISPFPAFSIIKDNKIIQTIQILNEKSNKISDCIIPIFFKLQKKFQLDTKIEKLIVCTGPGSFTSLRVGIAFMYGLSFSKNIPLIGISSPDLFQFMVPKSKIKKTLMFTCSSNNLNFIITFSNQAVKCLIKQLDYNLSSLKIDYNKYIYSVSNYKLSSDIVKTLNLNNHQVISFSEIIRSNMKKIVSLPTNDIIEPIYISNNKKLN